MDDNTSTLNDFMAPERQTTAPTTTPTQATQALGAASMASASTPAIGGLDDIIPSAYKTAATNAAATFRVPTATQPTFNGTLGEQYRTMYDTALRVARGKARGLAGVSVGEGRAQPANGTTGVEADKRISLSDVVNSDKTSSGVGGLRRTVSEGVVRYGFTGADGVSFDLPDGIDVNDANAVNSAMANANADYRMMKELYGEED